MGRINVLMLGLARKLSLTLQASGGSNTPIHAEQLYTDAALVLDASTHVAAAATSGLVDLHFAYVVDHAQMWVTSTVLMLGLARKLTLQASGGSNTPSSYTQTQRSR